MLLGSLVDSPFGKMKILSVSTRSIICKVEYADIYVYKEFRVSSSESSLEMSYHRLLSDLEGVVTAIRCDYGVPPRLCMEWCEEGSIRTFVLRCGWIGEAMLLRMLWSMVETLNKVHERRIVHRAINCDNWLVTRCLQVKLTDFGNSKLLVVGDSISPNSLKDNEGQTEGYSRRIFAEDVRRLGKVCFQMAAGDFEAKALDIKGSEVEKVCRSRGYSPAVARAILPLLCLNLKSQRDVGERLTTLEILTVLGLDLGELGPRCSHCEDISPSLQPCNCEHSYCPGCVSRIMKERKVMECPLCGNTFRHQTSAVEPKNNYKGAFLE